ncbi:hypothetical protein LCGC14_1844130 [marine sediment metagenome]|uniref:Tail fiber protein n=1 Tax=marine sediment metagenome TaxID=412755 RepID=A0A0F9GCB5_9ZZZZ
MGTNNFGTQTITFDYGQIGTAKGFNKLNYKLLPAGVYEGGLLTYVNANTVTIAPLVCFIEDSAVKLGARVETINNVNLTITEATPYVIARLIWADVNINYMDFFCKAVGDLLTTDVIIGKGDYVLSVLQVDFLYNERNKGVLQDGIDIIDSEHYVSDSIDLEHMSANSIDSDQYVNGSIDSIHLATNSVETAKIKDLNVTTEKLATNSVETAKIVNSNITVEKMAANSIDSDQYVDGSIDNAHYANGSISTLKILKSFSSAPIEILAGEAWVIPEGAWNIVIPDSYDVTLSLFASAAWRDAYERWAGGFILSNGSSMKLINREISNTTTIYYQEFTS